MNNPLVLIAVILAGIVVVWFGAQHLTAVRSERAISVLTQYRMIGALTWISCVGLYYQAMLVEDVKVVVDHDTDRQCENRNLNRTQNRDDYEERIVMLELRVAEAEGRVPITGDDVPGYGDYQDPAVQRTVDALIASTEADRLNDIEDARADLVLEQEQFDEYKANFPLEDCNGDGVIEVVPGGDDTRLSTIDSQPE